MIVFLTVLSLISLAVCSRFLRDPYREIQAAKPLDKADIPNMTFDSRGMV
jgi:hypothetical protein